MRKCKQLFWIFICFWCVFPNTFASALENDYRDIVAPIVGVEDTYAVDGVVNVYLFYGDGCPHCAVEKPFLEKLEKKYKGKIRVYLYEVWNNPTNDGYLSKVKKGLLASGSGVPFTVVGKKYFVGYGSDASDGVEIENVIKSYLQLGQVNKESANAMIADAKEKLAQYLEIGGKEVDSVYSSLKKNVYTLEVAIQTNSDLELPMQDVSNSLESLEKQMLHLPIFGTVLLKNASVPIVAIVLGSIDGFNPCAMWVLLFLINMLFHMKNRKRMWILGFTFLFTSAFVYFLAMLGIHAVLSFTTVSWIRNIIACIAIIGGLWNLNSYRKSAQSGCTVVDDRKRKKIFERIKKFTNEKSFVLSLFGVMVLAISVNLVELACSMGFPVVFMEILNLNEFHFTQDILYILLYIFFFLLDDLIVFSIAMVTLKVTGISTKYNRLSHLIGGIIMILIGALLLFKPAWLMFGF